jgi:hypothetical protein
MTETFILSQSLITPGTVFWDVSSSEVELAGKRGLT